MDRNSGDIKLNETIKRTLRNYEASYSAVDWAQMESMLDVAPKQNPLSRSYSPFTLYALIILGAILLIYYVFKPSEIPEKINTTYAPPVVKKKSIKTPKSEKSMKTHSVVVAPVLPPVKKELAAPVKTIATRSATTTPAIKPIKKDVKTVVKPVTTPSNTTTPIITSVKKESKPSVKTVTTRSVNTAPVVSSVKDNTKMIEKKAVEKKIVEKKAVEKKVVENKNSKPTTLSSQESKAKLFQKTLEKNKKAPQKEMKQESNDTVHIDDENDSNRRTVKITNTPTTGTAADTLKSTPEKKKSTRETRRSRRDNKTSANDTLSKNLPQN